MHIRKLVLNNFRGFEHREFFLNSSFTVAIGDNGSGKSTLLHALQVATGTFFLGLPYVYRRHINEDEIRSAINPKSQYLEHFTPTSVTATGNINGSGEFIWRREIPEYGKGNSSKKSDVGTIRDIAENYAKSIHNPDRPLFPIIAFFGVKQMGTKVAKRKRTKSKRVLIRDGYYNALGQKSDESAFTEWFYNYDEGINAGSEVIGTREAVFTAIETAIPFLKNVSFDRYYFQLKADVEMEDQPPRQLLHSYMSDGIKRMLGIVADVAYRCTILNGFKGREAVNESEGIVMIDELDMHLHPNWQRHVVKDLQNAFPKIQFIVTTHSPFIVQSLKSDELINLDTYPYPSNSPEFLPISKVATEIMGVESIRSDDFDKRFVEAKKELSLIKNNKNELTLTDYEKISSTLGKILIDETNDPTYKAYLESKNKDEAD